MPRRRGSENVSVSRNRNRCHCSRKGLASIGVGAIFICAGLALLVFPDGDNDVIAGSAGICILSIGSLMIILSCVFVIFPTVCARPEKRDAANSFLRERSVSHRQTATTEFSNNISTRTESTPKEAA